MGYNYDLFVSYSASDNIPSHKYPKGWVSNLVDTLSNIFDEVFDEKIRFLPVSDKRPSFEQLSETCLFVCVLSPEYTKDSLCLEDLNSLNQVMGSQEKDSFHRRILKIVKHPVAREAQPTAVKHLVNYNLLNVEFFDAGSNTLGIDVEREFKLQLADLAYDIKELLIQKNSFTDTVESDSASANVAPVLQEAVYLAETGTDLLIQRQIIKRELEKQGYRVLPEQKLPSDFTEIEASVRRDLEASKISIHLIGQNNGEIPRGTDRTIVEIQNKFATEHSLALLGEKENTYHDPAFSQFIWVDPKMAQPNENQMSIIEGIKRSIPDPQATQLLQTPLKNLRMVIRDRFNSDPITTPGVKKVTADMLPEIYFIYDKVDSQHAKSMIDLFQSHGFTLSLPVFEGPILEIRKTHITKLITYDVALIYKKQVNEEWLRMKTLDLLKAPGYGRKKEFLDKVILTEGNDGKDYSYYISLGLIIATDPESYINNLMASISAKKNNRNV